MAPMMNRLGLRAIGSSIRLYPSFDIAAGTRKRCDGFVTLSAFSRGLM